MSKIVFLNIPAHGHVNPTLPLVQELVRRGEQVLYYNTEDFRPQIERTGASFRAYPDTEMTPAAIANALRAGNITNFSVMVLQTTEKILTFLLEDLPSEAPDLIIFDSLALWGKMAATLLNVRVGATISHFIIDFPLSTLGAREVLLMLRQALPNVPGLVMARRQLIRRFGKAAFPPAKPLFPMRDKLNLVFTSRELQPEMHMIDATFRFVGPSINPESREVRDTFPLPDARPVIYLSLGTVHHATPAFFRYYFDTFRDYPAQFIISAGNQMDLKQLGEIPPNFIVRRSVPQLDVLQHTDIFITHGGMNSVHEGLYFGVPLVVIPQHFEQLMNGKCAETRGAAIVLDDYRRHGRITASRIRDAVERMVSEPQFRSAARQLQQTLRSTGGYSQAADEIQMYLSRP